MKTILSTRQAGIELAKLLDYPSPYFATYIRRLIREGKIIATRVDKNYIIKRANLIAYADANYDRLKLDNRHIQPTKNKF